MTSAPTELLNSLLGTSDWVVLLRPRQLPGRRAAGLDAVPDHRRRRGGRSRARRHRRCATIRERRFLTLGLLAGLVLVGFGYAGTWTGCLRASPAGVAGRGAGAVAQPPQVRRRCCAWCSPSGWRTCSAGPPVVDTGGSAPRSLLRGVAVLAVVGLASPWLQDAVALPGASARCPDYWPQVADYLSQSERPRNRRRRPRVGVRRLHLGQHARRRPPGVRRPHRWAVRNVIPLAEPGNVVWLDTLTRQSRPGCPARTWRAAPGGRRRPARGSQRPGSADSPALRIPLRSTARLSDARTRPRSPPSAPRSGGTRAARPTAHALTSTTAAQPVAAVCGGLRRAGGASLRPRCCRPPRR